MLKTQKKILLRVKWKMHSKSLIKKAESGSLLKPEICPDRNDNRDKEFNRILFYFILFF